MFGVYGGRQREAVGLNLVIGCHKCRQRCWTLRGHGNPIYRFALDHWVHWEAVEVTHDQTDREWQNNPAYINMSVWYED